MVAQVANMRMPAIMMAAGEGSRLHHITWNRTKALVPMVGMPMAGRLVRYTYVLSGFKDIHVTTCIRGDQIERFVNRKPQKDFLKANKATLTIFSEGRTKADLVNTAEGAMQAYKKAFEVDNFGRLVGFRGTTIKALADAYRNENIPNNYDYRQAVNEVSAIKPLLGSAYQPFIVTGCDALTSADIGLSHEVFLSHREKYDAIGLLSLIPFFEAKDITGYGVVVTDNKEHIVRFEEKPGKQKEARGMDESEYRTFVRDLASQITDQGFQKEAWLVNPQLYHFDPAIFAIVEAFVKNGFSPDWGGHILPLASAAGLITFRPLARSKEYWNDIGSLPELLRTAMHIIRGLAPVPILQQRNIGPSQHLGFKGKVGETPLSKPLIDGAAFIDGEILPTAWLNDAIIESRAKVGGKVVESIIFNGARVPEGTTVTGSIIGFGVHLPPGIELDGVAVAQGFEGQLLYTPIPEGNEAAAMPKPLIF